jgi:hypothetical protein
MLDDEGPWQASRPPASNIKGDNHVLKLFLVPIVLLMTLASGVQGAAGQRLARNASRSASPSGVWILSKMIQPLAGQTANALAGNRVLLEGGLVIGPGTGSATGAASTYSAANNQWTAAAPMGTARDRHFSVRLPGGSVLIGGGFDADFNLTARTEIYDPRRNTWTQAAPLPAPAASQVAVVLPNGKVLVAGGLVRSFKASALAWLYDPRTNIWHRAANMLYPRVGHEGVLMGDGRVLVAGGGVPSAEIYNPALNAWRLAGRPGARLSAAMLPLGKSGALLAGGQSLGFSCLSSVVIFAHGSWAPAQSMSSRRCAPLAATLPDGSDVVGGGFASDTWGSMQRMLPGARRWSHFPSLHFPRCDGSLTYVNHGLLAAGGYFEGTEIGMAEFLALPS